MSQKNKFWLVWNLAGDAPRKKHETQDSAIEEAKRLARLYPYPQHEFSVLEATHTIKADVTIKETVFFCD